jgi:penicillin-binding protein 1A
LEETKTMTSKVTSEYVALTMVDIMRGVTSAGGTAPNASAAGHPLAGKTGTVNDQTDVWFIGYTPTYVTGVWMGNPERKESLGAGMTGGQGALPYFNAFMNPFMKDKPKEKFPEPPPMPSDIKSLVEQRKREELEKLEKAEQEGRKIALTTGIRITKMSKTGEASDEITVTAGESGESATPLSTGADTPKPAVPSVNNDAPAPKVVNPPPPVKKTENPPAEKQDEGTRRRGKKGDG